MRTSKYFGRIVAMPLQLKHSRIAGVLLGSLLAGGVACHSIDTGPNTVNSIELVRIVAPSVVLDDTLRDTLGIVQPLRGIAYNIQGDPLTDVPVRIRALDTSVFVDSITGILVGKSLTAIPVRLVAEFHDAVSHRRRR